MRNEDLDTLIGVMREKISDENMALISEEITTLITDTHNTNTQIDNKDKEIENLTKLKDNLIQTNGSLLSQISVQQTNINQPEDNKKETKHFSLTNSFDKKGNFI